MRSRRHLEICPPSRGLEIGPRGRGTIAVADGVLAAAKAFLLLPVIVVGDGQTCRQGGLDPGVVERIGRLCVLRADRSRSAAPAVLAAFPLLAALEVGQ